MKNRFTNDNRGVSEVIGAILVFGLLIALMAIIQTQAVPAANQQVEFDHNQEVQGDLAKFHERASRVSLSGSGESVSIKAGTGYPSRMLFFNPPRATGTISTSTAENATLQNVKAVGVEESDYLSGDEVNVTSRAFEYRVDYNEFQESPTTRYEYGILYDEHKNATIVQNSGSVIDDTNINLVFMQGNYSESSGTAQSVDIRPVSAPSRPVTVTGQNDENLTLVLPTKMSAAKWDELYGDQDTVLGITEGPRNGTVKIDLDGNQRYTMRMAGLGLEQGVEKPEARYIVPADDGVTDVGTGGNTSVAFEVRDKYNNPVAGEEVNITFGGDSHFVNTTSEGRAVISVPAASTGTANATIVDCEYGDACEAKFNVNVLNPGGMINPSGGVRLQSAVLTTDVWSDLGNFFSSLLSFGTADDEGAAVNMEFSVEGDLEFESIRINYYSKSDNNPPPVNWAMSDGSSTLSGEVSGEFQGDSTLNPENTIQIAFSDSDNENVPVKTGDFFVITAITSDGQQSLYFVSPNS